MNNPIVDESLLDLAHRRSVEFLRALPERHVGPRAARQELIDAWGAPLSEDGEDPAAVLDSMASQADRAMTGSAAGRYFGFVIGGSLPVAVAADWLTSAWDQNCGTFSTSPGDSVAEEISAGWLLDLLGLPKTASAGFVTGGQTANFTCLAAARHWVLRNAGWNVEEEGLQGAPRVNVVLSAEAHITVYFALRLLGLGNANVHKVDTDEQGRMRADKLAELLPHLSGPTIISSQVGNVNTGSIDPVRELARIAHEHEAWLHVDGAFGLWGMASRDRRPLLEGVQDADSWATDAHKWLNVPYDCGVAIVRHSAAHRAAMTLTASYLEQTSGAERDPFDWTPEFSRRARGFTVYAALRTLGRRGVEELVDRCCARARQMASLLARDPRARVLNDVVLNQALVRFKDDDDATRETVVRAQRDGTCWMSGTTWHDMAAMRISVSNWSTSEKDVERSAAAILRSIP